MRTLYKILTLLYILLPLIIIPFVSYKADSPYFLLGIIFSYIGSWCVFTAFDLIVAFAAIGMLYVWFSASFSIYDFTTFYFLCLSGGYLIAKFAKVSKKQGADPDALD